MNFKPNRLKIIISILAGVFAFLFRTILFQFLGFACISGKCPLFSEFGDGLQAFFIVLILTYVIWSFVEKRNM